MAIVYFPSLFEDELLYSLLSRFYAHTGALTYRDTAGVLFQVRNAKPSIEFVNKFSQETKELLLKQCSMEELIERHTMFPMYMRFYDRGRKKSSFHVLTDGNSNKNIFPRIAYKEKTRYLRYCPVCVQEDRERYGETYWHRNHQLYGNEVCHIHQCYLADSSVKISGNVSPDFVSAESEIAHDVKARICKKESLLALSKYMIEVFQAPMDFENDFSYGEYLGARLDMVKYLSESGVQRKLDVLYQDYLKYYEGLDEEYLLRPEQVQKLFNGKRVLMHEICQMALFEGLSVNELLNPHKSIIQENKNVLYQRVSENLGIPYETIKLVGDAIASEENKIKQNSVKKARNLEKWSKLDEEMLPRVKQVLEEVKGTEYERPVKISMAGICKIMNVPDKRFEHLPKCRQEIIKVMETQEHYWARELVWAVRYIKKSGEPMNWKHIRNHTNLRKINVEAALSELKAMDAETYELIKTLL